MKEFTVEETFDWFRSIFSYCGTSIWAQSNEDMMYYLFEELPGDATSCLHINTLNKLKNNGYLDGSTVLLATMFRTRYLELETQKAWSAAEIRQHEKWQGLMRIADLIKNKLNLK